MAESSHSKDPRAEKTPQATGRLARVGARIRSFSRSPLAAFLLALVVTCVVALLIWWFVMESGIGAPAGFVYEEY